MPVAATIAVNDRATPTPVLHNFVPAGPATTDKLAYTFKETATVPIGEKFLSVRSRDINGRHYTRLLFVIPVVATETVNGISVPKVVREGLIDCTFRFDRTSTEQERADSVGMFYNMLAAGQATINGAVVKLEHVWS